VSISLVEELEAEHRDMRTRLVLGTFDRRDYYELAAHIETEEQELFPMTPFGLDEDDWDTMAEAHLEAVSLQGCSTGATEREG
jgi:hemerythrin-like domain-containing protein